VSNLPELPESEGYVHYPAREYEPEWTSSSDAYTAEQMRAFAEEAVKQERERAAKVCEALRDDHCAGTKKSPDKTDWCEHDDQCCEFVVAWNEAAAAIRLQQGD